MKYPRCIICGKKVDIEHFGDGKWYAHHTCSYRSKSTEADFDFVGPVRLSPEKALTAIPKRFLKKEG